MFGMPLYFENFQSNGSNCPKDMICIPKDAVEKVMNTLQLALQYSQRCFYQLVFALSQAQ